MYLHFSKNNRKFEVQNELEQSHSQFLNQNKAQAIRCKSFNLRYPARFAATWAFVLQLKTQMQNEKRTSSQNTKINVPRIHVEIEDAYEFAIYVEYSTDVRTVIRGVDHGHLPIVLEALATHYQQQ